VKKILIAAFAVSVTLIVPIGEAFAEPFPGRQPPCSIIRRTPLESGVGTALCTHPVPENPR
jgi:hypothetical protein